ncbi:hypothetical protein MHI61_07485 [Rhizobium sp. K102]|nr:hypothetical protein MHI61_07485 [Rhizobium sp. K102]
MTAKQAADARMWAGVHFRSDVVAGQNIGEGVAEQVIAFAVHRPSGGRDARLRMGGTLGLSPELSEKGGRKRTGRVGLSTEHVERRLTAILAADISGYSRLMGNDEEGTLAQLKAHRRALVDRKINEHRGRIVKTTGDGMLVEFASVVEAVRCAVEIQRGMAERNVAVPAGQRIEFRVGINVGDIIIEGDDIFGDGVNVAARLEGLAEPGGICVSGRVQEDAQGKLDIAFEDIGEQKLKNIARPVRTFRVRLDATAAPALAGWRRGLFAALALMILLIVGALWTGLGPEWKFLSILRSGDQFTKSAEVGTKPAIAILPFLNNSDESAREHFADGLTQDIINALGRFSALTVMSWNAVLPYKGTPASPEEIGRGLAVSYLVEGSVRQTGDRVRVIAQLVDTRQGRVLWSARFDEALADVFALQDNIVTHIVRSPRDSLDADRTKSGVRKANRKSRSL